MLSETYALTVRELKKWYRRRFVILVTLITPIFWLTLFGKSFNFSWIMRTPANIPDQYAKFIEQYLQNALTSAFGTTDYFSYMACGMFNILVLFNAMFSGMSLVWDRRLGFLNRMLTSPIKRESIFLSKVLSTVVKALVQVTVLLVLSAMLGFKFNMQNPVTSTLGSYAAFTMMAVSFSSIFVAMSIRVTNQETLMAVNNLLNMPLMFTSNAFFPISQMPNWLQPLTKLNQMAPRVEIIIEMANKI